MSLDIAKGLLDGEGQNWTPQLRNQALGLKGQPWIWITMEHFLLAGPSVVNWCGNDQRDSSGSLALPTFLPVLLTEQAEQRAYFSLTVYRMDWCLLFRYKHVHGRTCKASLLGNKYLFNIFWQQISERFTFPLSTVQASLTWLDAQVNGCTAAKKPGLGG